MHECMETLKNNNPGGKIVGTRKKFRKFQILSQSPEESVMGETDCVVVTENSVVDSKCRSSASELGFEARNSMVVFKSSGHGNSNNSSNQCHVCRFCSKVFRSGKALGGHVRIHGASRYNGQSFSCGNVSGASDYSSTDIWCKKSKVPTYRSNANSNWVRAESIEGQKAEGEEQDYKAARNMIMDSGQEESSDRKMASLYALRRNPKRSRRLTDEDFSMDLIAKNSRACVECGKEFPSSKALSGHMRCHPERHWRGIRPPYDNTNSVDTHAQCNTTGGDIVPAPSSGVSSICWQSSQGSEDLKEKWNPMAAASDDMSRRERMNGGKAAQQPASCSLLSWSVTAKRGRRRPIRSTQPPEEEDGENEEEEAEVHNAKELEDDRDTAHFLVMLACSAANGNDTNKVDRHVQRQMTEESVYHSGTVKETFEVFEAGVGDPGWKKKLKKRTDKSSRPVELGAGKYKCSTCKKLFNTHQALGGHRSSHRKDKDCPAIEEVTEEEITEEGSSVLMIDYHPAAVDDMDSREKETGTCLAYLTEEQSTEPAIQVKKSKVHECCTCHRVFPSGQALGGHKRSHCTADRITERTNNVTSTEKQPKLLKGQVREPLLDLNQPATADGEDFEAAFDMVKVGTPFAKSLNHKIKMTEIVTMNTGFRYVECNICGCLFTSMDGLRAHQIVHA